MLTYSRSKGLFAGINLDGATLSPNEDSVHTYYGSLTTSEEELAGKVAVNNTGVQFVRSVSKYFGGKSVNSSATLPDRNYQVVRIFFATDRALGKRSADMQIFTGARSGSENFSLGEAEISIPRDHKMGKLEQPSLLRLEFRSDPEKHVVLLKSKVLTTNAFQAALGDKLKGDAKRRVLVFVHGYNVSFEDAARRLGQMTYDLGFSGAPILYSWPSRDSLLGYAEDEASVEWSIPHFTAFLRSLHLNPDVQTIYVVGHSMGNRLVTNALKNLASNNPTSQPMIRDVIMAAPDIDEGVFRQTADTLLTAASRITVYESSNDNALVISHRYHGYARLGDTNPTVHVLSRYECIEASSLNTGLLGHSYIGDSSSIMADVYDLMTNGLSAGKRFRLVEHRLDGLPYWSFKQ
jgi:esterase/lipase superfamily enzyme